MKRYETVTPKLTRSLSRVNIVGVAIALIVSSAVLLIYEAISLRASLTDVARLQAAMVSENLSAALMFGDRQAAADVLRHLRSLPYVESAAVFDKKGARFVLYAHEGISELEQNEGTPEAAQHSKRLSFSDVFVSAPIELNRQRLGTVVLVATTAQLKTDFARYAVFLLGASASALLISRFIMTRMKLRLNDAERRLEYLALTDPLTGLSNRRAFFEELDCRVRLSPRTRSGLTLVLIDVDDFKTVNDTLGHVAGDELLQSVAATLRGAVRSTDIVSRIGGDEFAVLVYDPAQKHQYHSTAENIIRALARPLELHGRSVRVTVSVGFSRYPGDAGDAAGLVSSADVALYAAKSSGKNTAVAFRPAMIAETQRRANLERDLRVAIENDELGIAYQPQFDCITGNLIGAEALVRWLHPVEGPISPAEFVPIAESSDLIVTLGMWVMRRACRDALEWNRAAGASVSLSVNVSARQLRQLDFGESVFQTLGETGLHPKLLVLELTESLLMANVDLATEVMRKFRAAGVRLSIDDFGTGYSSLSYLQHFPINELKIDRSFVCALPASGQPIVTAIISMAHSFGLTVVAEGVENPSQLEWLVAADCDVVQGYLTGQPTTTAGILALIAAQHEQLGAAAATDDSHAGARHGTGVAHD
ncbi:EAL domain-containing protein (plasmid) [Paraburkholderia sp. D15]|uniref:putative bifunctional diguanylate cyclase/phosphodiesterase n=1 Tax=Paraburkholderia sp. D15 TaxID=2880218 RepID=UPI0024791549|nr:EAL domain-containing protein [Paraburkholderia sp. D15]WGS54998.1 EAL domain-containing protein [Paraburkholderia sp. D15]